MGIEPTPPQLQCDALPVELLSPWEQGGGERGSCIQLFLVPVMVLKVPGFVYKCYRFDIYDGV